MKSLLFSIVVLLFALNVSAQNLKQDNISKTEFSLSEKASLKKPHINNNVPIKTSLKTTRAITGEFREFLFDRKEYIKGVSDLTNNLYRRITEQPLWFDGSRINIPNFIKAASLGDEYGNTNYVVGELSDDGKKLIVESYQPIGLTTYVLCACNPNTLEPMDTPIEFNVDLEKGILSCTSELVGVYDITDKQNPHLYSYCTGPKMYDMSNTSLFEYSYKRHKLTAFQNGEQIKDYVYDSYSPSLGTHFIKGLLPKYHEGWIAADVFGQDLSISAQSINDDVIAFTCDGKWPLSSLKDALETKCLLSYNEGDSYIQSTGNYISDLFVSQENKLTNSVMYNEIFIDVPISTNIENIVTDKAVVSTEYYDLSGRRVDAAAKGVTIRVEKYADGTSKAVKTIK